jgi:hypothetical protein
MKRKCFIGMVVLAFSCTEEPLVFRVDPELLPYLQTFYAEAELRGIEFKEENLILEFGTTADEICGQSTTLKGGQRKVVIIKDSNCWLDAPTQDREALVFHELGHSLLGRSHRNDTFTSGDAVSLMHGLNQGPYSPCVYDLGGDGSCDKTSRRSYYLNELFDPSTPAPDWGG